MLYILIIITIFVYFRIYEFDYNSYSNLLKFYEVLLGIILFILIEIYIYSFFYEGKSFLAFFTSSLLIILLYLYNTYEKIQEKKFIQIVIWIYEHSLIMIKKVPDSSNATIELKNIVDHDLNDRIKKLNEMHQKIN